jgi:hypothetical protein
MRGIQRNPGVVQGRANPPDLLLDCHARSCQRHTQLLEKESVVRGIVRNQVGPGDLCQSAYLFSHFEICFSASACRNILDFSSTSSDTQSGNGTSSLL